MSEVQQKPRYTCGVGVWMGPYPAENVQQELLDKYKADIEQKSGKSFPHLKAVNFRRQIMTGENYIIKAEAGDEYIHVRFDDKVTEELREKVFVAVQVGKTLDDNITVINNCRLTTS